MDSKNNAICIIDYGVGNIGSIVNMVKKIGCAVYVSEKIDDISDAAKLIFPGVGNFDYGMEKLTELGIISELEKLVFVHKTPILGICLGAQLMTKKSDEGKLKGLGWFDAEVVKFKNTSQRIPHMGWNYVKTVKNTELSNSICNDTRFYFVHSFYIKSHAQDQIMFTTKYGHEFVSGLNNENIYAVQFHPEKSHVHGLNFLKSFIKL